MRTRQLMLLTTLVALAVATASEGAGTDAQKCNASKLKASGKKAACRMTQMAKDATGGAADLGKCSAKFTTGFTNAEAKAGLGVCPTEGDTIAVESRIDADTNGLQAMLSGVRFVYNGDGTVTDNQTGLQWERKGNLDGTANLADPHDADNSYSWSSGGSDPDGTAFTDFLPELNGCESADGITVTGGFADHCDWRLPTIAELQTIVDLSAPGCSSGSPCIDAAAFGPTVASGYWSSTTFANSPLVAWYVAFGNGYVGNALKGVDKYVRAVRGGS